MNCLATLLVALSFCLFAALPARAAGEGGVVNSPHNLSTRGAEQRVCIFCHTPHHATRLSDQLYSGPLWNRDEVVDPFFYTPYISSTLIATQGKQVAQPQGPSRICLSCHDGTIALASTTHGIAMDLGPLTGPAVLGRDLRRDHPISIEYTFQNGEYADPGLVTGASGVKLVRRAGTPYVECTSCHDPHNNEFGNFMVVNTAVQADALCTVCHTPNSWPGSSHQKTSVLSAKGCMNCHATHKAQQGENLLTLSGGGGIDTNCTGSCHNDTVGRSVGNFNHGNGADPDGSKHRGSENLALAATWGTDPLPLTQINKHVHCVDCHNPHQSQTSPASPPTPPDINGVLKGVRGVDINGEPRSGATPYAQYEYEICFRCHSGDDALSGYYNASPPVVRIFNSWNERERFNFGTAKSWHPVAALFTRVGNSQGLSLIVPGTRTITCNDCHDPHGSSRAHRLRLDNPDTFSSVQSISYPLCYSCHNETYITSSSTNIGRLHKAHVLGIHQSPNTNRAACSNCHDPHGVPNKFGLTTDNNSLHLMNFDTRYAGIGSSYDAAGGSCSLVPGTQLSCHPSTANPALFTNYNTFSP